MFLTPEDLAAFATIDSAKAEQMIEDAEAMALLAAPCLSETDFLSSEQRIAAVRAILRGAILRWNDAGSGAVTQQTAGPFSQSLDTRTERRPMFWPSEIAQLRDLCSAYWGDQHDAGGVNMIPDNPPDYASRPDLAFQWWWPAPSQDLSRGW